MEQQRAAADAERAELQKKLDELEGRLPGRRRGRRLGEIARANHDAIVLVTVKTSVQEEGFCTAFAVSPIAWSPTRTAWRPPRTTSGVAARSGSCRTATRSVRLAVARMKRVRRIHPPGGAASRPTSAGSSSTASCRPR